MTRFTAGAVTGVAIGEAIGEAIGVGVHGIDPISITIFIRRITIGPITAGIVRNIHPMVVGLTATAEV